MESNTAIANSQMNLSIIEVNPDFRNILLFIKNLLLSVWFLLSLGFSIGAILLYMKENSMLTLIYVHPGWNFIMAWYGSQISLWGLTKYYPFRNMGLIFFHTNKKLERIVNNLFHYGIIISSLLLLYFPIRNYVLFNPY